MLALQITLFIIAVFVLLTVLATLIKAELNGKGFAALLFSAGYILWCIISVIIWFFS